LCADCRKGRCDFVDAEGKRCEAMTTNFPSMAEDGLPPRLCEKHGLLLIFKPWADQQAARNAYVGVGYHEIVNSGTCSPRKSERGGM